MKIVVTGAAGFLGTNMVRKLLDKGLEVVGTDSLNRRGTELNLAMLSEQYKHFTFRKREIEDMAAIVYDFRPDVVFHFAAQVAVTSSVESPYRDFKINAEGSFLIARAAADVSAPVIYTSTNKVYGDNVNDVEIVEFASRYDFGGKYGKIGLPESFSIDAAHHTPYGISKLVGEMYVREFGGIANRCSCMYGPNQFGIVDQGWLSHIATNKILGRPTLIYGDGKQLRDAVHIDDVTQLLFSQMEALTSNKQAEIAGHVFNVGGGFGRTISLLELCNKWNIKPEFREWRPADQKVFYCDTTKAEDTFDWSPRINLDEGLADLYKWTENR